MPIHNLTLVAKKTIAKQTIEFQFEKPENFNYLAGQYGGFTLINPPYTDQGGNTRRFSLVSSPDENTLALVTRIQPSAYKKNLEALNVGDQIKFAGPTGNFILHDDVSVPTIFIAGGIGIAPFYSMIKQVLAQNETREMVLFYGNQQLADTAYYAELCELAKTHANFKLVVTLANPEPEWTGEVGFITDALVLKHAPKWENSFIYVCGGPRMVGAMQEMLAELGADKTRVMVEDFPGY
jgi:ferredoxin-NADP reductase